MENSKHIALLIIFKFSKINIVVKRYTPRKAKVLIALARNKQPISKNVFKRSLRIIIGRLVQTAARRHSLTPRSRLLVSAINNKNMEILNFFQQNDKTQT